MACPGIPSQGKRRMSAHGNGVALISRIRLTIQKKVHSSFHHLSEDMKNGPTRNGPNFFII